MPAIVRDSLLSWVFRRKRRMSRAGEWNLWHFLAFGCKLKNVHDMKNLLDSLSTLHLEDVI